jgi:hypothetical protein
LKTTIQDLSAKKIFVVDLEFDPDLDFWIAKHETLGDSRLLDFQR